jgi:hypothetical protein
MAQWPEKTAIFGRKLRVAGSRHFKAPALHSVVQGRNIHAVGGAARDRDHRNLPNNQVARQPLKQSPKRSCAE